MGLFNRRKKDSNKIVWRDANNNIVCPGDSCPKDCDDTCPIYINTIAASMMMMGQNDKAIPLYAGIIDQIVDWFGTDARITKTDDESKVHVSIKASSNAMEHWAMQYINHVEIISPESLRTRVKEALENGLKKYK